MIYDDPRTLDKVLSHLADQLATYLIYQIESGAQYVQIFDSWGGFLPPAVIPVSALLHCFGLMSQSLGTSSVAIVNKASWEDPVYREERANAFSDAFNGRLYKRYMDCEASPDVSFGIKNFEKHVFCKKMPDPANGLWCWAYWYWEKC
jgi:hypothetical protein